MTFIIEAVKDDHYTTEIRSSAIVAGYWPASLLCSFDPGSTGHLYSADRFNLLLTGESLSSQP